MSETPEKRFADVKAYEIAYAVFRVAEQSGSASLRESLEQRAFILLDAVVAGEYENVSTDLRALEYLLRFGSDVGMIHSENVEKIAGEFSILETTIEGLQNYAAKDPVNLEGIFSKKQHVSREEVTPRQVPVQMTSVQEPVGGMSGIIKSGIRQSTIMDRIRQTGNCRLKDIQEILPECSERTIRYDLQSLVEQKLIERIGNGGPAVYYRVRQTV